MEHLFNTSNIKSKTGINEDDKISKLLKFSKLIYSENEKFNLTGHKSEMDIFINLIIGSLEPFANIDVPRGTFFADFGTGAGIPGIPFGIKYNDCKGILFDSNQKKIRFVNSAVFDLNLDNLTGIDIRIEEAGRCMDFKNTFDLILTRAMSDIYIIAELGAPLLKIGGYIYLYVSQNQFKFNDKLISHLSDLGLSFSENPFLNVHHPKQSIHGIFLKKIKETSTLYPRRMAVIKRYSKLI